MWKYNTSGWIWTFGTMETNVYPSYVAPQTPGSRSHAVFWTDSNGFWLFGGKRTVAATSYYSDIWRYSTTGDYWTWFGGNIGEGYSNCKRGIIVGN